MPFSSDERASSRLNKRLDIQHQIQTVLYDSLLVCVPQIPLYELAHKIIQDNQ